MSDNSPDYAAPSTESRQLIAGGATLDRPALERFPEPAAVVADDFRLLVANARFSAAAGLVVGSGLSPPLQAGLSEAIRRNQRVRCAVTSDSATIIYDLLALPLAGQPAPWLLLATEATVELSMRNALVESRARYMDIVALSGESAWETDKAGRFTFVTPSGMAGFEPRQLIGQDPASLLDPDRAAPTVLPFTTPLPLTAIDVWVRARNGHSLCYAISAVPLHDGDGVWQGARGLCRDVTEERRNRAFLAELRSNERLLSRITEVFRQKSVPDDMLLAAAEASMQGLAASGCQILAVGGQSADLPSDLSAAVTVGSCGEAASLTPLVAEMIADPDRAARVMVQDGWSLLLAPTIYGGDLIGAILLWRSPAQPAWSSQEAQLIGTLAGQLAAAIDQRANYLRLLDASRTDPLTGLFNRRAFDEELHRRLVRLKRDGRLAALLYVDLDNFKVVNDLRGHALGDEALRHVADILRSNTRSSDLLARIGGDEFAVWLEDVTESDAIKRARTFLVAGTSLTAYSGNDRRPLQMSIGIAPHDPARPENIDALMKRADAAMYQIKRSGKGNFAVSRFVDGGGA